MAALSKLELWLNVHLIYKDTYFQGDLQILSGAEYCGKKFAERVLKADEAVTPTLCKKFYMSMEW